MNVNSILLVASSFISMGTFAVEQQTVPPQQKPIIGADKKFTGYAVIGLTKSAALEYADQGIRINAVCPGIIETPMVAGMLQLEQEVMQELMRDVPSKRLGQAEEIAQAVLWLSGPYSRYVIGHALVVDGGLYHSLIRVSPHKLNAL